MKITLSKTLTPVEAYMLVNVLATIDDLERCADLEVIIAQDAEYSVKYAKQIKQRFRLGEAAISRSAEQAYLYAEGVIKGIWPDGEKAIAKNPQYAFLYARDIERGPWPEGEEAIATDARLSYDYARYVLRGRFELGEEVIKTDKRINDYYNEIILSVDTYAQYQAVADLYKLPIETIKEIHKLCLPILAKVERG